MMVWIKKYWPELVVFAVLSVVLINDLSPAWTWMNTDSDGAHYTLAAKYMTTAHHMSAPLYLLIGRLFLFLPLGTEAWRMGLMSVLGTMGSAVFIYLVVRHLVEHNIPNLINEKILHRHSPIVKSKLYALISVLVFGGSALVISQSTIIETYTLATMCALGAYYFALKKRWLLSSLMIGVGLVIHPLFAFITWMVLFVAYKEMRNWRRYVVTIAFFSFYLYIPIVKWIGNDLGMWANTTTSGFFGGTIGMVTMLTGGLSIWDFPKRAIDTIIILLTCFGIGIVPLVWYFIRTRTWKSQLLWLTLIPIIYFVTNLANETYVYLLPAIAFGSVAIGLGLSRLRIQWAIATCLLAVGLFGFNSAYFDIGNNLDPDMSAMKFYDDLDAIPDGEYFMGGGWTWAMVYVYNKEEDRDIIPISVDALTSYEYQGILDDMDVKYNVWFEKLHPEMSQMTRQGKMAMSIARLNDGVWIAKETKPEVYQYEIVLAKGNENYIGRWIGQDIDPRSWQWNPSNPWLYISGQLEVSEWHHILWSNHNMLHIMVYGMLGYGVWLIARRMWKGHTDESGVVEE